MKIKMLITILLIIAFISFGYMGAAYQEYQEVESTYDHLYETWKNTYLVELDDESARVLDDQQGDITVSEGIGYGMLFSAMQNDRQVFDQLFTYAGKYENENGFMHWKIESSGQISGLGLGL